MKKYLLLLGLFVFANVYGQCPDPTNVDAISITENSADITWVENGTATAWEIEIVISGTAPTGVGTPVTANPYAATSLVSGETYDVYLRSDCGAQGFSNWVGPHTFTTISCVATINATPGLNGCLEYCFSASGSQFGTFFDFNSGMLPAGWNSSPFTVGSPCFTNMVDNSPYFWAGVTDANGDRQVSTNPLDVSLGGSIEFYMRYGSDDPDPGCETVDLPEEGVFLQYSTDGINWVTMTYWQPTDILTDPLYAWTVYTEAIPPAAQTTSTQFRWFQDENSGEQFDNWGLDNVAVTSVTNFNFQWDFGDGNTSTDMNPCHEYAMEGTYTVTLTVSSPTCTYTATTTVTATAVPIPVPIDIMTTPVPNGIQIDWTPVGSETSWNIEVVPAGTPPTGVGINTSMNPYVATGLTSNTAYDVYIQPHTTIAACEAPWLGPFTDTTPCDVLSVPYVEPVETQASGGATAIANCWSAADTNFQWEVNSNGTPSTGTGPNGAANGVNYFYTEATGATTGDEAVLLSPFFDLTTSTNTFLHFNYHMFGAGMGSLHVDVFNGTTWINDIFVLNGQQQTSNGDAWIQQFIDIGAYETVANFQVRFRGIRGPDFTSDIAIDDITIESITCPRPANFTAINITETTVELSWTETGTATQWEIEAVPQGTPPTGTGIVVTTNPYIYTGLSANTTYDFYIRSNCSDGTDSSWAGPLTVTTLCGVFGVPYVEPVETQIIGGATGIDNCWSATDTPFQWRVNSNGTPSTGTGPNGAANGLNYFYTEATGAGTGDVATLLSPIFDLTTSTNTFLHFNYHMFGADMGSLRVDVFDGTTWINDIFVLSGQQQTSGADAWIQQFIDIGAYETVSNFQVRFRGIRGPGFTSDMAIDDITIESITCPSPLNFTATNITDTTVDLSWTEAGTATQWEIEAVPQGTPPTGMGITVTTNPYTYTGLSANTTYDFYIRANCSDGTDSSWTGPISVTTPCTVFSVPYVEPVETQPIGGAAGITNCWSAGDTNFQWEVNSNGTPSTGTGPNGAANGVNYFYTEATGASPGEEAVLLSPLFNLTTSTNTVLHFNYHMFGSAMGSLHVDVYNGTTWINDIFVLTGEQQTSGADAWIQQFIDISAYETVANFQVRFRGIRGTSFTSDMAIDDITIESLVTCPAPTNFTASNATDTTVDLSWTEAGTATQWEIEAVPQGTPPTGTGITVTTNPYTYTGLTPNTTYDFYIRANCSDGTDSSWVGPRTITTPCDDISFTSCPTTLNLNTDAGQCYAVPNYPLPTIVDNCDPTNTVPVLTQGLPPDGQFPIGTTAVVYTATNAAGTVITCSFDVIVADPFDGLALQATSPIVANEITLCTGETTDLSVSGGSFDGTETYQWSLNSTPIAGETASTLSNVGTSGLYSVDVTLGTCSVSFSVTVNAITLDPSFAYSSIICTTADASITGTTGGTFAFSSPPGDGAMIDATTGTITNGTPGSTYDISYSVAAGSCQESSTQSVTLMNLDDASFSFDVSCTSVNITIDGVTGGTFDFASTPSDGAIINATTGAITNGSPDSTYSVTYTTPAGDCQSSLTQSINMLPLDDASFMIDTETLSCTDVDIVVTGTMQGTFSFDPTPSDGATINPMTGSISNATPGETYTIAYTTNESCSNVTYQDITMLENCIIPKGISPNGDNKNDYFEISWLNAKKLMIYNRQGMKLYEKINYKNEWNGVSKDGDELPTGTYFYVIETHDQGMMQGWIYVNRN